MQSGQVSEIVEWVVYAGLAVLLLIAAGVLWTHADDMLVGAVERAVMVLARIIGD